jgi:hypothetical protein
MGFKLNLDADRNGTHLQGYVELTYANIVAAFGEGETDGDKTTQEWSFESDNGEVFTLYDWKTYSTPQHKYRWHVGGHTNPDKFISWIRQVVGG